MSRASQIVFVMLLTVVKRQDYPVLLRDVHMLLPWRGMQAEHKYADIWVSSIQE